MAARVRYLAADFAATVVAVAEEGRRVTVETEQGEVLSFALNRSTGQYQTPDCGPRLALG